MYQYGYWHASCFQAGLWQMVAVILYLHILLAPFVLVLFVDCIFALKHYGSPFLRWNAYFKKTGTLVVDCTKDQWRSQWNKKTETYLVCHTSFEWSGWGRTLGTTMTLKPGSLERQFKHRSRKIEKCVDKYEKDEMSFVLVPKCNYYTLEPERTVPRAILFL